VAGDGDAVAFELIVDEGAELGIDGGQDLGELFDLGDLESAGGERFGHLQADVAGADDDRAIDVVALEGVHEREGVAHGVQKVHPVAGPERVKPGDRGAHGDGTGAHDKSVVAQRVGCVLRPVVRTRCARWSMRVTVVSRRRVMPVACRSARVRCARLRQWVTSPET
jgi:hypothetical protein